MSRELTKRAEGVSAEGVSAEGVSAEGVSAEGVSAEARGIAWEAQVRLYKRMQTLTARGKHHKRAIVAVAGELAGFLWPLGQQDKLVTSAA